MQKSHVFSIIMLAMVTLFVFQACEEENERKVSTYNDDESHYEGDNCMACHVAGGEGEGWFNVAGTVYDSLGAVVIPNATINLFTGENGTGTLKATIEVDGLGNFYTTEDIDFGDGLFPSVTNNSTTKYMSTAVAAGACNSCHGVTTGKLWVE